MNERALLLNLLRSAILGDTNFSVPESLDWGRLIEEAGKQGMSVIASDGLQVLYDQGIYMAHDDKELRRIKARWFGQTMRYEHRYAGQVAAAKIMGAWLAEEGIQTVVLKGLVVAECYPIPSHRYSSDMDCFLIKDGEHLNAYELGNKVMETHGLSVDRSYYKNSKYDFSALHVENHKFCTPFRGNETLRNMERFLQRLILDGPLKPLGDTGLLEPPSLFSALFLIEHSYSHFLHEGLTLKHVLDWALFRRKHADDTDWDAFRCYCREFGLLRFAEALENVCDYVLYDQPLTETRIMEDIWKGLSLHDGKKGLALRLSIARNTLNAGWKYRRYSEISMLKGLWIQVKGFFWERNPRL